MRGQAACVLSAVVLSGCGFVHDETIVGPYRLVAIDVEEEMDVCYSIKDGCIGRIPATVFATGFNHEYIVAARHPNRDRSKVEYFYLIRSLDGELVDPSLTVKGPFDAAGYQAEQIKLGLPAISKEIGGLK